jgi:hypothetical protein
MNMRFKLKVSRFEQCSSAGLPELQVNIVFFKLAGAIVSPLL